MLQFKITFEGCLGAEKALVIRGFDEKKDFYANSAFNISYDSNSIIDCISMAINKIIEHYNGLPFLEDEVKKDI